MPLIKNCGACDKPLAPEKESICFCDKCRLPLHSTCSGLSRSDVQLLSSSDSRRRPTFYCDNCVSQKNEISELKDLITKLSGEVENLKLQILTPTDLLLENNATETLINEINERNKRSSNIIIYNLVESTSDSKDVRIAHDVSKVIELINKVPNVDINSVQAFRLGKVINNKPRPIKVILNHSDVVKNIFKNKSLLQQGTNIRIASDQTPLQRQHLDKLRQTLEMRLSKGERDLTIKYVKGIPTITTITPKN